DFARNHALYRLTTSKYIINLSATNKLNKGRVGYHVDCWYLRTNSNKIAYENRCKTIKELKKSWDMDVWKLILVVFRLAMAFKLAKSLNYRESI
ncbi:hypothetical protein Goari_018408, partial [Gossypium aridum]|nr:hypothetical protein [Gossypium aridum]